MSQSRREFIGTLAATTLIMSSEISFGAAKTSLTVQQVIDLIIREIPGAPYPNTVDTLKAGSPDQIVTGIVSTSFATIDVIEKAAALGANFIIAHEPTFYNHLDDTNWLQEDVVYQRKRDLLKKHDIAVWRFHDYIHSLRPDGVQIGVLNKLGWDKFADKDDLHLITLPATPLKEIIAHVKSKLDIQMVRVIGDPSMICKRIALLPGAPGGRNQITALEKMKPDLMIGGELSEWETAEYIRDGLKLGDKRALIILGHAQSEEPGMEWLVGWLGPKVPGIKIIHVTSGNPFKFY